MLASLASFCYRRRRIVLLLWVVALFGFGAAGNAAGKAWSTEFSLAGSDSQVAMDLLGDGFQGATGDVVFKADAGLQDPSVKPKLEALFADLATVPGVRKVESPFTPSPTAPQIDPSGRISFATIDLGTEFPIPEATIKGVEDKVEAARAPGLQIEMGGQLGAVGPSSSEALGLIAAVVILVLAFGSIVAAGMPIFAALFGLGVGASIVGLLAHVVSLPEFSTQLAAMIGIGVGIDYALFIVTRYRQGLSHGLSPHDAVVTAVDTAGRAVLFAGTTVVISLGGMLLMGIQFIAGLGLGSAAVVAVTMLTSVTLVPALLGFAGQSIDKLRIPGLGKNANAGREGFWFRWSRFLQRHPWPFAVVGLLLLVGLSLPVLGMRLGSSDNSNLPTSSTVRRAYDLKVEGFGAGANTVVLLVARIPEGTTMQDLAPISQAVAAHPNVAKIFPPLVPLPNNPGVAISTVTPKTSGQDAATQDMIVDLRENVLPAASQGTGAEVHVGGETAMFDDMSATLQKRLPLFIGVVLGLSFLLLMIVFRSIIVPLKAVVMNLLSIGAAYGIVVAVFQNGVGASLIGVGKEGPIESFVPMMMFAILFGLSMDYEVFLLSRIKEEYDRTGDNAFAVADGLSHTARVITAAALIMITVFGAFVIGDQRVIKEMGLGLAVAILIDASIVRMILVPATMELLGNANWWFPKWLQWLPTLHVEGHAADEDAIEAEYAELIEEESAPAPS